MRLSEFIVCQLIEKDGPLASTVVLSCDVDGAEIEMEHLDVRHLVTALGYFAQALGITAQTLQADLQLGLDGMRRPSAPPPTVTGLG